jgi:DNA-binding GntR family transcriptional regulator
MKKPPTRAATSNLIYDQITLNLLNQIDLGELSLADNMPPEHELSENLRAKRLTF